MKTLKLSGKMKVIDIQPMTPAASEIQEITNEIREILKAIDEEGNIEKSPWLLYPTDEDRGRELQKVSENLYSILAAIRRNNI